MLLYPPSPSRPSEVAKNMHTCGSQQAPSSLQNPSPVNLKRERLRSPGKSEVGVASVKHAREKSKSKMRAKLVGEAFIHGEDLLEKVVGGRSFHQFFTLMPKISPPPFEPKTKVEEEEDEEAEKEAPKDEAEIQVECCCDWINGHSGVSSKQASNPADGLGFLLHSYHHCCGYTEEMCLEAIRSGLRGSVCINSESSSTDKHLSLKRGDNQEISIVFSASYCCYLIFTSSLERGIYGYVTRVFLFLSPDDIYSLEEEAHEEAQEEAPKDEAEIQTAGQVSLPITQPAFHGLAGNFAFFPTLWERRRLRGENTQKLLRLENRRLRSRTSVGKIKIVARQAEAAVGTSYALATPAIIQYGRIFQSASESSSLRTTTTTIVRGTRVFGGEGHNSRGRRLHQVMAVQKLQEMNYDVTNRARVTKRPWANWGAATGSEWSQLVAMVTVVMRMEEIAWVMLLAVGTAAFGYECLSVRVGVDVGFVVL
ncbi:hypothetical protein ACLOJK_021664 [Asimina triloba]